MSELDDLHYLGFDVSTTGTAAVLLDPAGEYVESWVWQNDADSFSERCRSLHQWARFTVRGSEAYLMLAAMPMSLSMEAPFVRGPGTHNLIRAQGAIMPLFSGDWTIYPPSTVKAWAKSLSGVNTLAKGVGKPAMAEAMNALGSAERYVKGYRFPEAMSRIDPCDRAKAHGDLVDAFWVATTDRHATLRAAS